MGTEKIESVKHEKITATPYDDVFRTLLNDCEQLIIPMINEIFGKNYTGKEKIVFHPNEHFINQQDDRIIIIFMERCKIAFRAREPDNINNLLNFIGG